MYKNCQDRIYNSLCTKTLYCWWRSQPYFYWLILLIFKYSIELLRGELGFVRSFAVSYLTRLLSAHHSVCLLFLVWTTASICAMETSYPPDFRPSKTRSTSSVIQKLELTPKTTWDSSLWPSRMKIWFSLFVLFTETNLSKSIDDTYRWSTVCVCFSNCEVLTTLTPDTGIA